MKPDATRYVMEGRRMEIASDCEEVIIEVCGEGRDKQRIGGIGIPINEVIEDHLVTEEGEELAKVIKAEMGDHENQLACSLVAKVTLSNFDKLPQTDQIREQIVTRIEDDEAFEQRHRLYEILLSCGLFREGHNPPLFTASEKTVDINEERGVFIFGQDPANLRPSWARQSAAFQSGENVLITPSKGRSMRSDSTVDHDRYIEVDEQS